jgi:hypothetical protein
MRLVEEITTDAPDRLTYFDYLTLDPEKVDGKIVLAAKSVVFGKWMKSISLPDTKPQTSTKWGGTYHCISYERLKISGDVLLDTVGTDFLIKTSPHGAQLNLAWLRHTKLSEGIEIEFTPLMSMADYEDFIPAAANALRSLYLQNVRLNAIKLRMMEIL